MARDYKSRANPPRAKKKEPVSGWIWFTGGLLVGLFVSALVWLKFSPPGTGLSRVSTPQVRQEQVKKKARQQQSQEKSASKPRFDFYTILPEMEVVVPDPEPEPKLKPAGSAEVPSSRKTSSASYMLQMGSFRKYSDADRLKASLALVGLEAEIQRVNINGGDIYHRVRSGPYAREQVNALRARLKANKINSLVIKLKK